MRDRLAIRRRAFAAVCAPTRWPLGRLRHFARQRGARLLPNFSTLRNDSMASACVPRLGTQTGQPGAYLSMLANEL